MSNTLIVSNLIHLYDDHGTQTTEVKKNYYRVFSDMIAKAIEGSITKHISIKVVIILGHMNGHKLGGTNGMMNLL